MWTRMAQYSLICENLILLLLQLELLHLELHHFRTTTALLGCNRIMLTVRHMSHSWHCPHPMSIFPSLGIYPGKRQSNEQIKEIMSLTSSKTSLGLYYIILYYIATKFEPGLDVSKSSTHLNPWHALI